MLQQFTIFMQRVILNPKKILKKLPVNCTYCGIEFRVWKCRIERANKVANGHLFCSRKCARASQPKRKEKFSWCDNCKWVLKTDLILKPKGTKNVYRSSNFPKNRAMLEKGNYNEITIQTSAQSYQYYVTKKDQYMCPQCKDRIYQ
jgi:hypothetical protein